MKDIELLLRAKKNRLAELERERDRLDALAVKGEITSDLVSAIAGNKVRLDLARRELQGVKEKAEADAKWRESKAYKAEESEMAKLRKEAETSIDDCSSRARDLLKDIDHLREVVKEHDDLARTHEKPVLATVMGYKVLSSLRSDLKGFDHDYRVWVEVEAFTKPYKRN